MDASSDPAQKVFLTLRVDTHPAQDNSKHLWEEIRTSGAHPSRRSYHSAVMWGDKMLIYGGQDLKEGAQSGLWMIEVTQFDQGEWEEIPLARSSPLCRHSAVLLDDVMYVFGGSDGQEEFNTTLAISLRTRAVREIAAASRSLPPPLDSHSACAYTSSQGRFMVVFGGFCVGERTNGLFLLNLDTETWQRVDAGPGPEPRSNHSAVVFRENMYVFGGTNDEGEKLNDLWKLGLNTLRWEKIQATGDVPSGRSGHSAVVYTDLMIVFGGMKDITKETNDMYSYSLTEHTWVHFQYEHQIKDPVSTEQLEEFKKSKLSPPKPKNTEGSPTSWKRSSESPGLRRNTDLQPAESSPKKKKTLYDGPASPTAGRIKDRVPHPRDGHSAVISGSFMIVFGGDRHQMPFNDCYVYFLVENTIKTPLN
jgi:hypothetical protein